MGDIALSVTGIPRLPRGERLLSDERLARLAGSGSARAFAVLYERNRRGGAGGRGSRNRSTGDTSSQPIHRQPARNGCSWAAITGDTDKSPGEGLRAAEEHAPWLAGAQPAGQSSRASAGRQPGRDKRRLGSYGELASRRHAGTGRHSGVGDKWAWPNDCPRELAERYGMADKGKTVTYKVSKASVKFDVKDTNNDGTVGPDDLAVGDRVHLIGRITTLAKKCSQTGFTAETTIRRIVFHAAQPATPQAPKSWGPRRTTK